MVRNYVRRDVDRVSESQIKVPELESKLVAHSRIIHHYAAIQQRSVTPRHDDNERHAKQYRAEHGNGLNMLGKTIRRVIYDIKSRRPIVYLSVCVIVSNSRTDHEQIWHAYIYE